MNEEISRVLRLLEEGKITADEAERLLRAVSEGGAPPPPSAKQDDRRKCEPAQDIGVAIAKAFRKLARRQRLRAWWKWYEFLRWAEDQRAKRAGTMTTVQRVCHLLESRGLSEAGEACAETVLRETTDWHGMGREVLRWSVEREFGVTPAKDRFCAADTAADLAHMIDDLVAPPAAPDEPVPDTTEPASEPDTADKAGPD